MTWERITEIAAAWLPKLRILHPWPSQRFAVNHPGSPVGELHTLRSVLGGVQ